MTPSARSDPETVERISRIFRDKRPDLIIKHRDHGDFGPVEFEIETDEGVGLLVIDWDCLQDDQIAVTEKLVRAYRLRIAASAVSWRISVGCKPTMTVAP